MKKGLWKRRAFAFLVAAAMVIPQGVYAAETGENGVPQNVITEGVPSKVHDTGCILDSNHEGDCVTAPAENEGEQPERTHEDGCMLAPDHEGNCVTVPIKNTEEEQFEKIHEDGCMLDSDHEGACEVEKEKEVMLLKAPRAEGTIYVSNTGDDENGDGSEDAPYGSLKAAVNAAADGDTIVVMDDITVTELTRIVDKDITITSEDSENPVTVTRGIEFETAPDSARVWYNPAMIEVTTPDSKGASVRLENIILDDAGLYEGEYFTQASDNGTGSVKIGNVTYSNTEMAQDAIIAAYGTDAENPNANIYLGNGAVLKNYGGMSAVRVTKGASLTMESGSLICDDADGVDRSDKGIGSGRYGAVLVQGTHMTMDQGAVIADMTGRVIFLETNASAEVNGTIENITNAAGMRNGANGIAIYVYGDWNLGHSVATLGSNGRIHNIKGTSNDNDGAVSLQNGKFVMEENSKISNVNSTAAIYLNDSKHNLEDPALDNGVYMNGIVENCTNGYIFRPRLSDFTLGETGIVKNCEVPLWGGVGVFYSTDGANYIIKGTVTENTASRIFYICRHQNKDSYMTIEEPAKIINNSGNGVYITNSSHLVMNGGEISGNGGYGVEVGGKSGHKGVSFEMNGGLISNNTYGAITYTVAGEAKVDLNGGIISGNGTNYQILVSGGSAKDANEHVYINEGVLQGNKCISLSSGILSPSNNVILDQDYSHVSLGNASANAKNEITNLVAADYPTWEPVSSSALWIKPEEESYHFQWSVSDVNAKGLYVVYIPVNADGTPEDGAVLQMKEVPNETVVDITLDGLDPTKAYAVMLVNNDTYVLSPEDITIYTGGKDYETTHGLPEDYTLRAIGKISSIKVGNVETTYSKYSSADQEKALADLKTLLNVSYVDDNGVPLADDRTAGDYTAKITYVDPANENHVKINGNNVKLKDGKLIIRYIENEDEAIKGESVIQLLKDEPTELLTEHAVGVEAAGSEYYINNDEDRKLTDTSQISLLDDGLLLSGDDNRQELMEQRANEIVKPSSGMKNAFEFHYLDLVDPNTGNAWVSSSKGTIVYLPYPEGTDQNTDFTLLHYNDLHREYGINGQENVAAAIAHTRIEKVDFTKEAAGIRFEVPQSGFSPFAIIWEVKDTGDSGSSSTGGSHTSNTYYVRYHNDDDTVKDGKFIPGETVTVKGNVFIVPVGKVLAGWSLEKDGKVDYKVGDTFRMPGSSVDLYAVWKDAEKESHCPYISGYPDGTVGPDKTITRAEAATMFYNLLADKTGDAKTFIDVPANQWYAQAVMTLAGMGVISGYPDGTFKPNASITRAEFVTMAMNFANADKGTACSFPDVPQNMWYYGAIAGATQNGWISGYPDGTFGPERYITRAEVTSVINRMENRLADMSFVMEHLDELRTFSDLSLGHWAYGSMMEAANGHDYTRADEKSYESWVDVH